MSSKEVLVFISIEDENIQVGTLWFHVSKGRERASFEYTRSWLSHSEKFALDPALKLQEGSFHTHEGISLFGAIGDSAPDRWGRVLMRRSEIARAQKENRASRTLFEIDYLLGVSDEARQGALRFALPDDEDIFLTPSEEKAIPPLVYLPKLLSASEQFTQDKASEEDLKLLLAPGSSLGGARPKASIIDKDGTLAIAKFPRKGDEFSVVIWEAVALQLAEAAGIKTPSWRLEVIQGKPVLIIKRFDRIKNKRIPFLSALSMLGARDNESHSYLEIAYALLQYGLSPEEDLEELWRRIVFTVLISNTDDHLRNHAFLYDRAKAWKLSPVYDINPTPLEIRPHVLTTAIDFDNTTATLLNALNVTNDFRISTSHAAHIIQEVVESVQKWRQVASQFGLSKAEINRMSSAFREDLF